MRLNTAQISALNALKGVSSTLKMELGYYNQNDGIFVIAEDKRAWFVTENGATFKLDSFWPEGSKTGSIPVRSAGPS